MNKSQQGITLLESLVALLILSIGLLGTAHLMATGIQQTNGSFARTQATYLAENLAERMRANPEAIINMDYAAFDSNTFVFAPNATPVCNSKPAAYCADDGGVPATCTATQLAIFDKFQTTCGNGGSANGNNGVKDLLPGGRLLITCNDAPCTPTSTYTLQVNWNETERAGAADATKTKSVQHKILP